MLHITKRVIHHQIKIGYSKQQFVTPGDFFIMCISRVIERRFIVMGRIHLFYTERWYIWRRYYIHCTNLKI